MTHTVALPRAYNKGMLTEAQDGADPSVLMRIPEHAIWGTHAIAELLCFNPSTVKRWTTELGLPCYKTPGGHRRVHMKDLDAWLRAHEMPVPFTLVKRA